MDLTKLKADLAYINNKADLLEYVNSIDAVIAQKKDFIKVKGIELAAEAIACSTPFSWVAYRLNKIREEEAKLQEIAQDVAEITSLLISIKSKLEKAID